MWMLRGPDAGPLLANRRETCRDLASGICPQGELINQNEPRTVLRACPSGGNFQSSL